MNNILLYGRMTDDAVISTTGTGLKVANFTLAVDRDYVRKDAGENEQTADFLNCVAWRQSAEYLEKYSVKGMRILATGKVQTRTWEDEEDNTHYVTEVVCDSVKVLDYKESTKEPAKKNGKYRK